MPSELLSEQLVVFLLILAGGSAVAYTAEAFAPLLDAQARMVGQQKLEYFYDLVGYSWLDQVETHVVAPAGTQWIAASGTTLTMKVNGTTYIERYPFEVASPNITNPGCLELRPTASGVQIFGVAEVDCSWPAS